MAEVIAVLDGLKADSQLEAPSHHDEESNDVRALRDYPRTHAQRMLG